MDGLRACPLCGDKLLLTDGPSPFKLLCDGKQHAGPRALGSQLRFSCFSCHQFDACETCALAMPASACMEQVNVKLGADGNVFRAEEDTFGLGYSCRVRRYARIISPLPPKRDNSLRDFVPRDKYQKLQHENEQLRSDAKASRRSPSPTSKRPISPVSIIAHPLPKEVRKLNGEEDARIQEANDKKQATHWRKKAYQLQQDKLSLECELQNISVQLRSAQKAITIATAAEVKALKAETRHREALRHRSNCYNRQLGVISKAKAKAESDTSAAETAAAEAEHRAAETEERAAAAEALASVAESKAAAADAVRIETEADGAWNVAQAKAAADDEVSKANAALLAEVKQLRKQIHGGRGVGAGLQSSLEKSLETNKAWRERLHLDCNSLPSTSINCYSDHSRNVRFLEAAMRDRPAEVIAGALQRLDVLDSILKTKFLQRKMKVAIADVLEIIQSHWSARHAVMLMSDVHLSRSEYDTLRHLLSFVYDSDTDLYERIVVWVNAADEKDTLEAPRLASRYATEKERDLIYGKCGAEVSDDGLFCGAKDLEASLTGLVEHYYDALEPAVQAGEKPCLFVLTGDATGGWRGDSVTHGEIGIGSFAKGKAQSKLAALPIFLMEGDDSADNLRSRAALVFEQYNALKQKGKLTIVINGETKVLPTQYVIAADFQFFKAIMNMSKYTSAVWCTCLLDNLFKTPDALAETWADVLDFYKSIGCELKSCATICELNHYSFEVLMGKRFKQFGCRCGWKSGNEKQWRGYLEAHAQLDEEAKKAADLEHSSNPLHCRHKPYDAPLAKQGTIDNSADILHLIFINLTASFMELTMFTTLNDWDPAARAPFEAYLRSFGVPIKCVKATSVTEMKQSLTGRDTKVLLGKALTHIPALLQFVHTPQEEILEAVAAAVEAEPEAEPVGNKRKQRSTTPASTTADDDFDLDEPEDDDEGGDEEEAGEDADDADDTTGDELSTIERHAGAWDKLLKLVRAVRPFEDDSREYREARGVETFNAAAGVVKEYKRLFPGAKSACPHVALCVVPRQQVELGDHERRGADHSEAYGASIKDNLHRRTLRRKVSKISTTHKKLKKDGTTSTWTQGPLRVGRVMQVYRNMAVSERVIRDEGSTKYLQRKHFKLKSTGFATAAKAAKAQCEEAVSEETIESVVSRRIAESLEHS